jgi:PAP2 superfamily
MEIFGRSPYLPSSLTEWLVFLAVMTTIVVSATLASDWPAAVMLALAAFASYLFDSAIFIPIGIALSAVLALAFRGRAVHARPGSRAVREGSLCALVFTLYETGRHLARSGWEPAAANAASVLKFERNANIDVEGSLQSFVLRHRDIIHWINAAYSWMFLPVVAGALFWLYITQDELYRRFRTSLGIAALLAVCTIALFPVAPPRLAPGSGLIGTHALRGGTHSFVNQFAAMPSLHVGWVAVSGVALFIGVRHWMRWVWLFAPVTVMAFVVIATGHHYLLDGLVGSAFAVMPFLLLTWYSQPESVARFKRRLEAIRSRFAAWLNAAAREIAEQPRLKFTVYSLAFLLTYMVAREIVDPGFTNYWGYMVVQIAVTIVIVLYLSERFAEQGGLSLLSHAIVVVTTYADTLGTAGHMYDRYITYDKVTHFLGTAAVASVCADCLLAMTRKGSLAWSVPRAFTTAILVAIATGIGWEIYEYFGDKLFNTGRHAGAEDTIYDIISDSVGASVAAALLLWWHFSPQSPLEPATSHRIAVDGSPDDDSAG